MALEDILEALEAEEKKQSEDIIARAQIQAAKLIAEAKEDAEGILAVSAKAAMENLRSQEAKILLDSRFKAKKRVAEAKELLISQVFARAESLITSARHTSIYEKVFKRLARETFLREIGDGHSGLTLEVSQDDAALAKAFIASEHTSNNVRVVSRDDINSGVALLTEGGRKTGVNTLESRFQKAQKLLRTRVGATLFNDDN